MVKGGSGNIANVAVIVGVTLYILGGIFGWQGLAVSSPGGYTSTSQEFAPLGMWWHQNSNTTNASEFLPFPSEILTKNLTNFPAYTHARTVAFMPIWIMFLINLAMFLILGLFAALDIKKAKFPMTIIIIAIIIVSLAYFVIFYQAALNEDLQNTGISGMNMFGDEIITSSYRIDSYLGPGFLFTLLALVSMITGALLYRVDAKELAKHEQKEPAARTEPEKTPAPAVAASQQATEQEEESHLEKVTIECPNCGREFEVQIDMDQLPITVQCPYCGTEGEIG